MSESDASVEDVEVSNEASTAPPTADITVARIGAYAAMAGAILAVGAAAVGAWIAGYYANVATDRQIAAASSQATTDFLREQQRAVYASFLAQHSELTDMEESLPIIIFHPDPEETSSSQLAARTTGNTLRSVIAPEFHPSITRLEQDIPALYDQLNETKAEVDLVGSTAARAAADELMAEHFQVLGIVVKQSPLLDQVPDDLLRLEELRGPFSGIRPFGTSPLQRFVEGARQDLGSS